jgi:predicted methyltransferase
MRVIAGSLSGTIRPRRTTMGLFRSTTLATATCVALISTVLHAQQSAPTSLQQSIQKAMQGDIRTSGEKARDVNRLPVETLSFFRMRDNMRVIEILPSGGWYTKILAPVLRDKGQLYVTHPPGRYADEFQETANLPGMEKVEQIGWGATAPSSSGAFGPSGKWNVAPVDLVLTFRNYHNFSADDRAAVNKSAFDALKKGGLYGIVDHTRRHNEPTTRANGRRVDPVLVIKEAQDAGFVLEDFSNVHFRPDDALTLEVGNPAVSDKTDRITLLFRKP